LDRGDTAVVPDPCYPIHEGAPAIAGADVVGYSVVAEVEPAKAVADSLQSVRKKGGKTKFVIANYPHNPTGYVISREALADLVRVVQHEGAMLLHDAAYADLDFSARFAPSIFDCGVDREEVKRFAVEVFSMSKSYNMPGWRIAFMVGNPRMVGALAHMKTYMDYGTFIPLQAAAAWALEHGDGLVDEIRDLYQARATTLTRGLSASGWGRRARAQRQHVRLGEDPAEAQGHVVARDHQLANRQGARRGLAGYRLRPGRRGLRALRADRGSAARRRGVPSDLEGARGLRSVARLEQPVDPLGHQTVAFGRGQQRCVARQLGQEEPRIGGAEQPLEPALQGQ
jgi:histidinol-phosphate/aromatic aminotransferase/cobyric acid decarboxylase-like protein